MADKGCEVEQFVCYHCKADRHGDCVGIPCQCPCPTRVVNHQEPEPSSPSMGCDNSAGPGVPLIVNSPTQVQPSAALEVIAEEIYAKTEHDVLHIRAIPARRDFLAILQKHFSSPPAEDLARRIADKLYCVEDERWATIEAMEQIILAELRSRR